MKQTRFWFYLLALICGIGCFTFFFQAYTYHLHHREQMLLFTYTWEHFLSYWNQPAALSCLLGDFFTQFLHLKVIGPLLIALTLVKLEVMAFLSFRKWMNLWLAMGASLLVFLWEGMRFCDILYPLAGTVSLIGGLFSFLCVAKLKNRWSFLISSIFGALITYYLFGYGVFVFAFCVAVESLMRRQMDGIVIPIVAAALPALTADFFLMMPTKAYTYPATVWMGKPDFSNERILALSTAYYHEDWNKVIEQAYQGSASDYTAVCYNLANAAQDKLPERLMYYYQPAGLALFMPIFEKSTYLTTQLAGEVWFRLGDMTMAEHAAMLSMIFSPNNKNVRMVKRMAEINLINGENNAALKYLHILSKTLFYKQWAEERIPGRESETVKKWLAEKRKYLPQQDTLRLSCTDVRISLHNLLQSNPDNKMACNYLLCFDLLMKDLDCFIADYQKYHKGNPNRLYAEALMIHLFQKHAKANEVKATGIHPSVIKDFNMYNRIHGQSNGNASVLQNQFGSTYWYYYQFKKFN